MTIIHDHPFIISADNLMLDEAVEKSASIVESYRGISDQNRTSVTGGDIRG